MSKSVRAALQSKGGADFHLIWIQYFTMPNGLQEPDSLSRSPADDFLFSCNYVPVPMKKVKSALSKCHNSDEITEALAELFDFKSVSLMDAAVVAQSQLNHDSDIRRGKNEDEIPYYVFRGFIALSYMFPCVMQQLLNPKKDDGPVELYENIITYVASQPSTSKDFVKAIQPVVLALKGQEKAYCVTRSGGLYHFVVAVMRGIVGSLFDVYEGRVWVSLAFAIHIFRVIFSSSATLTNGDPYVPMYSAFIQMSVTYFGKDVARERQMKIVDMISCFLIRFGKVADEVTAQFKAQQGLDSLKLLGKLNVEFSNELSEGVLYFVVWYQKAVKLESIFDNYVEDGDLPESLQFQTAQEYLATHRFLQVAEKLPKSNVSQLLEILVPVVERAEKNAVFYDVIAQRLKWFQTLTLIVLTSAMTRNANTLTSNVLNLAKALITRFNTSTNGVDAKFRSGIMDLLFGLFVENQKLRMGVLNLLSCLKSRKLFVLFLPLLRSLLIRDGDVNFVSCFLQSKLPERLEGFVKQEVQNESVNRIMAFLQQVLLTKPVLAFTSNFLVGIFASKAVLPQYNDLVIKSFKVGLQIGSQSKAAISIVLQQVGSVLVQIAEQPSAKASVADLIQYISESLPRFSKDELESVELKTLADLVPKLPLMTEDNECLLATLRLIAMIYEKFAKITDVFEDSSCYAHLKSALSVIPLSKESMSVMLKIRSQKCRKLLMEVVQGTELEVEYLEQLASECMAPANAFEFFECGVLTYALDRMSVPALVDLALRLYVLVGASFYSPLALADFLDNVCGSSREMKVKKLQSFHKMITTEKDHISSFFHMNDKVRGGIFGPSTDKLNKEWSFSAMLRIDEPSFTLLSLTDEELASLEFLVVNKNLCIKSTSGGDQISKTISFDLPMNIWFKLMVIVGSKQIFLVVDGEVKGTVKHSDKLTLSGKQMIKIAVGFVGDIGPVAISLSTDKSSVDYVHPTRDSNTICLYLPRYCHSNDINDVILGQSARLFGTTVLFSTTARNILKLDGTSEKLIPLFYHIDCAEIYHLLLSIVLEIMEFSDYFEDDFEATGAFQLLSGVVHNSPYFTEVTARDLGSIYKKLKSRVLKKQFIDFVLLNFSLFDGCDRSGAELFFSTIAPEIVKADKDLFRFGDLDFLLFKVQVSVEEDAKKLRKLQFDLVTSIIALNPSKKVFYRLFMMLDFNNDNFIRTCIVDIFEKFVLSEDKDVMEIFEVLNYCEKFWTLLGSNDPVLQERSLSLIGTIVNMAKKQQKKLSLVKATRFLGHCSEDIAVNLCCRLFDESALENCQSFAVGEYLPLVFASLHLCEGVTKESIYVLVMVNVVKNIDFVLQNMADPLFFFLFAIQGDRLDAALCAELCSRRISLVDEFLDIFEVFACVTATNVREWNCKFLMELLNHTSTNYSGRVEILVKAIRAAFYYFSLEGPFKEEAPHLPFSSTDMTNLIGEISNPGDIAKVQNQFRYEPATSFDVEYLTVLWTNLVGMIEDDFQSKVQLTSSLIIEVFKILAVVSYLLIKTDASQESTVVPKMKQLVQQFPSLDKSNECVNMLVCVSQSIVPHRDAMPRTKMYDDFMKLLTEQATVLTTDRRKSFFSRVERMAEMLRPPDRQLEVDEKRFESFTNNGSEYECYVNEYSQKLSQSFQQKIRISSARTDLKWKCSTKCDLLGRPIYMRVNDRFDDHHKAAALRDSQVVNETEPETVVPFKYALDPSVLFPTKPSTARSFQGLRATLITVDGHYFGNLTVDDNMIIYSGIKEMNGLGSDVGATEKYPKILRIKISDVEFIFNRIVMLSDQCCEVFTKRNKSYLFNLEDIEHRNSFYGMIAKCVTIKSKSSKYNFYDQLRCSCKSLCQNCSAQELLSKSKIVDRWRSGKISNYRYLFYLNILANRSFNDLSQYPVFPWILTQYQSETIDLSDSSIYRDLSKPIGALNEERLASIRTMLEDMLEEKEKCLYRMHYSSAASVIGYLIRTEPFAALHILLQGGRFDHADRIFCDISATWNLVSSVSHDFRELIPQFFCLPEMFINENEFNLGKRWKGDVVDNVELPKWATSAFDFTEKHRQALESDYVRENLHHWIDLIFGCYQKSDEMNNVFHEYAYLDCASRITDPEELQLAKTHSAIFGCCPIKLFDQKHPEREMSSSAQPELNELPTTKILLFDSQVAISEDGSALDVVSGEKFSFPIDKSWYSDYLYIPATKQLVAVSKNRASGRAFGGKTIAEFSQSGSAIQCITRMSSAYVLTAGNDCLIYVWRVPTFTLETTIPIQSGNITSISGSRSLDVIASVNERHQVFISYLSARKTIFVFQMECDPATTHRVELLSNGIIAVTCESLDTTRIRIKFFNLRGKQLGEIPITDHIVKLFGVKTCRAETFLVVSTRKREVTVINCSNFTIQKTFPERPPPHLVSWLSERTLVLSGIAKERKSVIVTF